MFTLLYVPARLRCPVRLLECPDRTSLLRPGGLQHATRYHAAGAGTGFRRLSGGRQNCTSWRLSFKLFDLHRIARISCRAVPYAWARLPVFCHAIFPSLAFRLSGKASDPEISPLISARCAGDIAVRLMAHVGWAAQRGPVFMLDESGPFPGSLPPNSACTF